MLLMPQTFVWFLLILMAASVFEQTKLLSGETEKMNNSHHIRSDLTQDYIFAVLITVSLNINVCMCMFVCSSVRVRVLQTEIMFSDLRITRLKTHSIGVCLRRQQLAITMNNTSLANHCQWLLYPYIQLSAVIN